MNELCTKPRSISSPVCILAVAAVYAVVAKLSFLLTISPGNISPIFPAAGVALAAVMILERNALIGIWLGSSVANGLSFFDGSVSASQSVLTSIVVASFIGLGATTGAGVGAFLVRRFCKGEHPLQGGLNVLLLITVGALGCGMISPTVGVVCLWLGGGVPWGQVSYSWGTWGGGGAVVTPL
ncbi:TPA: hypothetical protein DDW35_09740, partial [Candidatus Sumerlaeota bacterium]|nr:hypothetical protein [Candidatus Sumerlaeota bacterium]